MGIEDIGLPKAEVDWLKAVEESERLHARRRNREKWEARFVTVAAILGAAAGAAFCIYFFCMYAH